MSWPGAGRAEGGGHKAALWVSGSGARAAPVDTAQRRAPRGPHVRRPAPRHVEGCAPFPRASGAGRRLGPGGRGRLEFRTEVGRQGRSRVPATA